MSRQMTLSNAVVKSVPVNPRLPGRWGKMTVGELDAEVALIESNRVSDGTPLTDAQWGAMKRGAAAERKKRGRPAKPVEEQVARVMLSMPRDLLAAIDAAAAKRDLSRAAIIALGMRKLLKLPS